jgi:peptide/nickel transport system permease protein
MISGEAYLDIVWRQFRKNGPARIALWLLGPLFLVAVLAPLLASDQPLLFFDHGETLYPWFRALWNPEQPVDFVFNMALVALLPWAAVAAVGNVLLRRAGRAASAGWSGRQRVLLAAGLYGLAILALVAAFSLLPQQLRPDNAYYSRSFAEEEHNDPASCHGLYAPIPFGPAEQDLPSRFQPPGYRKADPETWAKATDAAAHLLGTDDGGRDVLARMIYGTRISLTVGFVAVGIYLAIGIVLGATAGYFGGKIDIAICRVLEVVMLFPSFFLILTLVALLGQSIYIIMLVIGLTGWSSIARLIRGEVLKQRSMDYVTAARALGATHRRIIFRHILANALSPALVAAPFGVADAITTEAGLSLLGFGVPPPAPSWGALLELGKDNYAYWWLIIVPSLAIFLTITLFNLVGSGLRDAMDPRLRR